MRNYYCLLALIVLSACGGPVARNAKTTFQTSRAWSPSVDNRADAVMVYGVGRAESGPRSLEARLKSWQDRGYETHFMEGIAWGGYSDYFTGEWDGMPHMDEGQVNAGGDTLWHSAKVPYIVPTVNYLRYFKESI